MSKENYRVVPHHLTPAQRTMARDMEVAKAGEVIDDALGGAMTTDPIIQKHALAVIAEVSSTVEMQFSLRQLQMIQLMVERGVMLGMKQRDDEAEDLASAELFMPGRRRR
jgi:hypothetical protein